MDGVAGLEPANDGIKIHCLTNLAIPQQNYELQKLVKIATEIKSF